MFNANDAGQTRRADMKAYEFTQAPSNATITSVVTVLVSAWFVLAGGAILTGHHSQATLEMANTPTSHAQVTPDAYFQIVVEARRPSAS
jgi:hypothetical protein